MTSIKFQSFLLGIWHFIVTERLITMLVVVFDSWHEDGNTKGATRKFISGIGETEADLFNFKFLIIRMKEKVGSISIV